MSFCLMPAVKIHAVQISKLPNVTVISFDNQNPSAVHQFHGNAFIPANEHDWVWVIDAKYSLYSKATLKFLAENPSRLERRRVRGLFVLALKVEQRHRRNRSSSSHYNVQRAWILRYSWVIHLLWWFVAMLSKRHFGENFQKMSEIAASGSGTNKLWWHSKLLLFYGPSQ